MGKYKLNVGDVYRANCGDMCRVVERIDGMHVVIEWQDEFKHRQIARPERVMRGKVYNPFCKSIYGIGYVGVGEYSPSKHNKIYSLWVGMFIRSYDQKFLLKNPLITVVPFPAIGTIFKHSPVGVKINRGLG